MSIYNPTHKKHGLVLKNQYSIQNSFIYGRKIRRFWKKVWCKPDETPPDVDLDELKRKDQILMLEQMKKYFGWK